MVTPHDAKVLRTPRLGLGTAQFGIDYGISNRGGQVSIPEVSAILSTADAAGIRVLDTAASYGTAEEALGGALRPGHHFSIVTKTLPLSHGLEEVEKRARRSLDLLGRKSADAILVHAAQDLTGPEGHKLWGLLQRLRDEGLYQRIGISAYVADKPRELGRRYRPDLMQVPFSLLDQRLKESGELQSLKELGIEIHVRSIFLQGLLLMDPQKLPAKLIKAAPTLAAVQTRIRQKGLTTVQAALGFTLAQEEIDVAIVGVTSHNELAEIVAASVTDLPEVDWKACAITDPAILNPVCW